MPRFLLPVLLLLPACAGRVPLFSGDAPPQLAGTPGQPCFLFTVEDKDINPGKAEVNLLLTGPGADCVDLVSGVVEKGRATFILCCHRGDDGAVVACNQPVSLEVEALFPGKPLEVVAYRTVQLVCR